MDRKLTTILLQFDFSKAFDTISPTKLLHKLKDLMFSRAVLLWIQSYITDRSQCVIFNSFSSETRGTNLGVPQGSVLGPLLFCLYINDLRHLLNIPKILRLQYADDLQIYIQVLLNQLQEGLDAITAAAMQVAAWASVNRLRLNASKTKAIIFGSSHTVKQVKAMNLLGISLGDEDIPFSDEVISLGVVLQNTLSWKSQIASISRKVNRALFGLRFIRACTTQALRKTLVETLVVPHLDYCSVVYLDLPFCLKIQLQRLANRAVRYVFNLRMNTRVTPYRCQLRWLRTDTRREYFMGLTIYKLMQLRQPNYLLQLFTRYESSRPSRGLLKDLRIPHVTSEMRRTSFQVQSARLSTFCNAFLLRVRWLRMNYIEHVGLTPRRLAAESRTYFTSILTFI